MVGTDSFGRGRGVGGGMSEGVVVEARCSGLCGSGQGSFGRGGDVWRVRTVREGTVLR